MKIFYISALLIYFFFNTNLSEAQNFTKIISGDVVSTPGDYRSVNWIDYDNDGFIDLLITSGPQAGADNSLFHNNGNGTFSRLSNSIICNDNTPSDGSTWADMDNDGDIDCFTVNWWGVDNLFYINNGNGDFIKDSISVLSNDAGYSETASWGDYDNDGLVDLYVTNSDSVLLNYMYHNDGNGAFTKISNGIHVTFQSVSRSVNWIDIDDDGDQDLFVTNESNQNENIYINDGSGNFTQLTSGPIVNDGKNTMSSSWADIDNDGDEDVFLANDQGTNSLFRNDNSGQFVKIISDTVTKTVANSFSSAFGDLDNDGDLDLLVTNSFHSNKKVNYLYFNNGDGQYSRDGSMQITRDSGWSYGCGMGDYDNDGFLDISIANCFNANQTNSLFHNDGNTNHWFELNCQGTISNRSAIGARIRIKSVINGNPVWQMRTISSQSGYNSQNMLRVHFGLGTSTVIDTLKIEWPSGLVEIYSGLLADEIMTAIEGQILSGVDKTYKPFSVSINNSPNPFSLSTNFDFSIASKSSVILSVFDLAGNNIKTILNRKMDAGSHSVEWNGKMENGEKIRQGIYVYVLMVDSSASVHKLIYIE